MGAKTLATEGKGKEGSRTLGQLRLDGFDSGMLCVVRNSSNAAIARCALLDFQASIGVNPRAVDPPGAMQIH